MSHPASYRWPSVSVMVFCVFALWPPLSISANHTKSPEFPSTILKKHRQKILQLSSDIETLTVHNTIASTSQAAQNIAPRRNPSKTSQTIDSISQEKQREIATFWAALTTIGYTQELRKTALRRDDQNLLETVLSDAQQEWLISKPALMGLKSLLEFQQKLVASPLKTSEILLSENEYAQFTNFYESSHSTTTNQSWINIFTDSGFSGIETKLQEYWVRETQPASQPISDVHKQAYTHKYIGSKILPLLHTHLLLQAVDVESKAQEVAWSSWYAIQQWEQQDQHNHALIRLCGTWKWIIHNHQNHGDHKSTMEFIPPGQEASPQVQPSTILIHGDTVYLKWIFPQGIQEDSLLLSNHDTRLEGTFMNSLGPYGSISGQRISKCKNR